jgi:flagellar basal body-associated protein FliL
LFGGYGTPERAESSQQDEPAEAEKARADDSATESEEVWYYPLEPVVANLDEPGVKRYVRATLMLAISSQMDQKEGFAFLDEKRPLLSHWLTIYLASLGLEEIRGEKNLRRIQLQILDTFNEKLFPDSKPQINEILFKEFAVQ